ncbi:Uncharacterized protein dnm_073030 [Desulfonema magnum]|uniref:Uncharacterized protein n=1 Tax=Desulfonema magnum TaxID=45655 RepID=A0A975BU21_9BACT|nr:Uncharacterized protein dnm_073030 [Desulfonema magnum]
MFGNGSHGAEVCPENGTGIKKGEIMSSGRHNFQKNRNKNRDGGGGKNISGRRKKVLSPIAGH